MVMKNSVHILKIHTFRHETSGLFLDRPHLIFPLRKYIYVRREGLGLLAWSSVLIMPDYSQWNIYVTPREMVSDSYQLLSISVGHNLGLSQICYAIQYIVV